MQKKLIILVLVLILIIGTGLAISFSRKIFREPQWKIYRNEIQGFSFSYPSDWEIVEESDTGVTLEKGFVKFGVDVKEARPGASAKVYGVFFKAGLKTKPEYTLISSGGYGLKDYDAYEIVGLLKHPEGAEFKQRVVIVVREASAYLLICQSFETQYDEFAQTFQSIIESFELVGERPAEEVMDTDRDGVPDNEDDYPTDPIYSAKLEVTKMNWYKRIEGGDGVNVVDVIFEYKNNKSYNLYWVQPFATIRRADGVIIRTYDSTWGRITDILNPEEKCYAWVPFEDREKLTASVEAEVKGSRREEVKELKVKIISDKKTYDETYKKYVVSGIVKNNGKEAEAINIYAGLFAADGTLLDVQEGYKIYIPAGESAMFTTQRGVTIPNGDKISTYKLCITRY